MQNLENCGDMVPSLLCSKWSVVEATHSKLELHEAHVPRANMK